MARMVLVEAGANCAAGSTEATVLEGMVKRLSVVGGDAGNVGTIAAIVVAVRFTTWLHFGSCSIIHC